MTTVEREELIKQITDDLLYLGIYKYKLIINFKNLWGTPGEIESVDEIINSLADNKLVVLRRQIDATLQKLPVAKQVNKLI